MVGRFLQQLETFGFIYQDFIIPFGALIIVFCLLVAAIIHWRFK
jgi:hypothetical protein